MSAPHPVWTHYLATRRIGQAIPAPTGTATKVEPAGWRLTAGPGQRGRLSTAELAQWLSTGRAPAAQIRG